MDEEERFWLDYALQNVRVARALVPLRGKLLDLPPGDIDRLVGRVEQLYEVVGKYGVVVTATAVDLVDDDVGAVSGCGCSRRDDGNGACSERDRKRGA